jgi:alpha-beta hydrolase superfamily lysophospholipase
MWRSPWPPTGTACGATITGRITVRWGTEILDAVARVKARAAELSVPMLLIHGEADRLNLPRGSRFLRDAVAGAELRLYPGAYHEPHNEPEHKQVAADVQRWLDRHASNAPHFPTRDGK